MKLDPLTQITQYLISEVIFNVAYKARVPSPVPKSSCTHDKTSIHRSATEKAAFLGLARYVPIKRQTLSSPEPSLFRRLAGFLRVKSFLAHTHSKQSIARKSFTFEDRAFLTQAREGLEPYFGWLAIKTQTKPQTKPPFPNSNKKPTPEHSNQSQFCKRLSEWWKFGGVPNVSFSQKAHMLTAGTAPRVPSPLQKKVVTNPLHRDRSLLLI